MWIRVTERPKVTPSAGAHSSGRKNCSFICLTWPFSIATIFIHVGVRKFHRDFRYTLVKNMLAHAGPEHRVPRPLGRPPNVESHVARLKVCGSKQWPIRSETQLGVACIRPGVWQKKFSWSAVSVTWDCVWNKHVSKTTTPRHNCQNIWCNLRKIWASRQYVSKLNLKFFIFHIIIMYNYETKNSYWFLEHTHNYLSPSPPPKKKMPFNSLFNFVWFPKY